MEELHEFHTLMQSGIKHMEAGAWSAAEKVFRNLLETYPQHDDALQLLGLCLFRQGQAEEGEALLRQAIRINPQSLRARNNLGAMLKDRGHMEEAAIELQQLYLLAPHDLLACTNLATVLIELGRGDEALHLATEAIALKPQWGHAHLVHGLAQKSSGDVAGALASVRHALTLEPDNPEFNSNLSSLLIEQEDYAAAEQAARAALTMAPDRADAHHNLGVALARQYAETDAINHLQRAIELDPRNAKAYCDLASSLCDQGHLDQSMALYRQALDINPKLGIARFGLGIMQLTKGDFANGWVNYEARKVTPELHTPNRLPLAPNWRGEDLHDKPLYLFSEQGFGDILQFIRFIPKLLALGARISLDAPPELTRLLNDCAWPIELITRTEAEHEHYDFECALLSLPMVFGTTLTDLPIASSYLKSDTDKRAYWQGKLAQSQRPGQRPRIGLCWAGNPGHKNDHNRSIEAGLFSQIGQDIDADFISLQRAPYDYELNEFTERGITLNDWTAEFFNFAETAALVDCLDLVISVDTVIAHLAGALGKPTWTLIPHVPDWRWLEHRTDSPWYPSMRLFRQPAQDDWESVIAHVRAALAKRAWLETELATHTPNA